MAPAIKFCHLFGDIFYWYHPHGTINLNVSSLTMDNYRKGQLDDATWNDVDGLFVDHCFAFIF